MAATVSFCATGVITVKSVYGVSVGAVGPTVHTLTAEEYRLLALDAFPAVLISVLYMMVSV